MSTRIYKNLDASLGIINDILSENSFILSGGADFMDKKEVNIEKQKKQFKLSFILPWAERKYFNEIFDSNISCYTLNSKSGLILIAPEKSTLINSQEAINQDLEEGYIDFQISASLSQFSNITLSEFENNFHRVIIPLEENQISLRDFQHYLYDSDSKVSNKELIKVHVGELQFHFFVFRYFGKYYWAIDSLQILQFKDFQEIVFSVFNSYGFIKGDLYLNEAYYFSSQSIDFRNNVGFYYSSLRDSLITGISMFTTNSYSILIPVYKRLGKKYSSEDAKPWLSKLEHFPEETFSKLAELFYKNEPISRAGLIVLEANLQALELKAASYCVAYESVCHALEKLITIKSPNVIEGKLWRDVVKPAFEKEIHSLHSRKLLDNDQKRILKNKLNSWNQPTNRDTLTAPFKHFGYELSDEEYKCIDNRNKFLHGSFPIKSDDMNVLFRELYYISLTIHRLLYLLIFKYIGFDGYIINYLKLHEHVTNKPLEGDGFIKI